MRWDISSKVENNTFDYFEKTLLTENGFREYDVRWLLGKEINPNGFFVLGRAYGTMAQDMLDENRVVVGHDYRSYSQELCRSLAMGLLTSGMHVIDVGLALTPMVYFAQYHFDCRAAAQVTASHNENGWTGLKLADGLSSTLGPDGIEHFKQIVLAGKFKAGCGKYETYDNLVEPYAKDLLRDHKLKRRLRVVFSAGNGTAGRFGPAILRQFGCDVVELNCGPDWEFKHFNPNPEDISFLRSISDVTQREKADLGIGVDGDGDRIGVVDDKGRVVFSDKLGLLVARWICKDHPGRSVVIDVKSTSLFYDDKILMDSGTKVITWKTGHSYIKSKVAEEKAIAGFEKSGHWFLSEPYGRSYDDALLSAIMVVKMLGETSEPLSQMIDALPKSWQSPTLGAFCPDDIKYDLVDLVTRQYKHDQEKGVVVCGSRIKDLVTINGVRFVLDDGGWGLVRASSNKPSLVIVAESRTSKEQTYCIIKHIQSRLSETGKVGDYDQEMPPL